ncbi:MAG: alpha/beta hydrolase [Gammaproteobacteria bacterium]
MRTDVAFDAAGTTLRGWLYVPDCAPPWPCIVMTHGFSALKEMGLDRYAEVFAAAGLACLVYDHRNFGASDGEPRQEVDPSAQMRDYGHAITWAREQPGIDPDRIGVWGTSYSGGLVLIAAATDRRIRCVVSQVPFLSGLETLRRVSTPDAIDALQGRLASERAARAAGAAPTLVPVCNDPPTPAGRSTHDYFFGYRERAGVAWTNAVTLSSLGYRLEYEALPFAAHVAPTPLLMIVAADDDITPTDLALEAFERAGEPKQCLVLPGAHYHPYHDGFAVSSAAARDWFRRHLDVH